jgi:integrase
MAPEVATALARLRDRARFTGDDDLVFPDWAGEPQSHGDLRVRFYTALRAAGLPRIVFHDLCPTFGTTMAGAGQELIAIQHWMGHAQVKTTMVYAHYQPSRQGAQDISAAFSAASAAPEDVAA